MAERRHPHFLNVLLLGVALLVSGCELAPISNAAPEQAPSAAETRAAARSEAREYAAPALLDQRIDFTLARADVDCTAAHITGRERTQVLSAHYVVDGKLGANCFGRTNTVLVEAWKVLVSLSPPGQLNELGVFAGYTNLQDIDASQSSVGLAQWTGWSAPAAQISIDLDFAFSRPLALERTLVHEMGHVISLVRSQNLPLLYEDEQCAGFRDANRCFNADSMMQRWVNQFWGELVYELEEGARPGHEVGRDRCLRNAHFWRPYSASNPLEDFADSYAAFVLRTEPSSIDLQEKMDWFAAYPELVEARERATQLGFSKPEWYRTICGQ